MARPKRRDRYRPGVRVGVDPGSVRIGVAVSDPEGRVAVPVGTVARGPQDAAEVMRVVIERAAVVLYVGLPRSLHGGEGVAAGRARAFAADLAAAAPPEVDVRLVDERLTTVEASRRLTSAGTSQRDQRAVVDAAAASTLLQHVLDAEQAQTTTVGESVPRERNQ